MIKNAAIKLVCGFFVLASAPLSAAEFSIATFNTYWFFDDQPPHLNWRDQRKDESYAQTLAELVGAIKQINADIISLQEVENEKVIDDLVGALKAEGLDYSHHWVGQGLDPVTGQDIAILSKFPAVIEPVLRFEGLTEEFFEDSNGAPRIAALQKAMRVDLDVQGKIVTIFAAHLKSQRGGESAEEERLAQARMLRRLVRSVAEKGNSRFPSYVAIIGDLNDDHNSPTLKTLRGFSDGSYNFEQPSNSIPEKDRYTHIYCPVRNTTPCPPDKEEREQLDHVLLNKFLNESVTNAQIIRIDDGISDHDAFKVSFKID